MKHVRSNAHALLSKLHACTYMSVKHACMHACPPYEQHAYVRIRVAILFVEDIFPPTSRAISRPPIMQHVVVALMRDKLMAHREIVIAHRMAALIWRSLIKRLPFDEEEHI